MNFNLTTNTIYDIVRSLIKDKKNDVQLIKKYEQNKFIYANEHADIKDFGSYCYISYWDFHIRKEEYKKDSTDTITINTNNRLYISITKEKVSDVCVTVQDVFKYKIMQFIPKTKKVTRINYDNVYEYNINVFHDDLKYNYKINEEQYTSLLKLYDYVSMLKENDKLLQNEIRYNEFNSFMVDVAKKYNIECKLQ